MKKMVIFHSHLSLPEGRGHSHKMGPWDPWDDGMIYQSIHPLNPSTSIYLPIHLPIYLSTNLYLSIFLNLSESI